MKRRRKEALEDKEGERKENEMHSVTSASHDLRLKRGLQKTGPEVVQDRVQ